MKMIFIEKKKLKLILFTLLIASMFLSGMVLWSKISLETIADPIYQGDMNSANVALTINVDWGQDEIPKMLDILEKKNVKATFYITGRFTEKYPDIVKEIHTAGHEIGNHGYSHPHPDQIGVEKNKQEILDTEEAIYLLTGVKTTLFAPPYGEHGETCLKAAEECGYQTILWTADTIDWQDPPPSTTTLVERVTGEKLQNGTIILMHPKPHTVLALSTIIDTIESKGYQLKTVSEILAEAQSINE